MSNHLPSEEYTPLSVSTARTPRPAYAADHFARSLAVVGILLSTGLYAVGYVQKVHSVNNDRQACVREQKDLRVAFDAWNTLTVTTGSSDVRAQAKQVRRILRRDCNKRYPDPALLWKT